MISVKGESTNQEQVIQQDTKSIHSLASQISETTYRSQLTKFSDSSSLFSDGLSKTTVNRLED